jgi:hypothetical protein
MQQRLAAREGEVADTAPVQDVERRAEPLGVDEAAIGDEALVVGEAAEIAGGVAEVGHRDVADRGPAARHQAQYVGRSSQRLQHSRQSPQSRALDGYRTAA